MVGRGAGVFLEKMTIQNWPLYSLCNKIWYLWKRNNWIVYPKRFFSKYADVVIDRPVFVVGNQGDGLTLVARMLRHHSNVISITGGSNYWSGADEIQNVMKYRLPSCLTLYGQCLENLQADERMTPPFSWAYGCDSLLPAFREHEDGYSDETAEKLKLVIRESLHRFGAGGKERRFVDKSQSYTIRMAFINALLREQNPFFVYISRNPYASCYRAAIGKAGDMRRYASTMRLDERFEICVQHWINSFKAIIEDKEKVQHFTMMKFEDFLEQPEASVKRLCDFTGLSFQPDMIPHEEHTIPFGNKFRERWYPLNTNVNQRYLDEIPAKYIEILNNRCQDYIELLKYDVLK